MINPIIHGYRTPISIGYKYKCLNILGFIGTKGDISTNSSDPYLYNFLDTYSIVSIWPVVGPCFLGGNLNASNLIYKQNKICQFDIALEKYWMAQRGYFIVATTVALGMGIADRKILFCHGISEQKRDNKHTINE